MYTLEDGLAELDTNLDDVGDVAGSTVGGATTGAIIGSFIPGAGTLVGAAVGASLGFLGSLGAKASGDGGVSSAKESISDVIDRSKKSVESKIDIDFININNQANHLRSLLIQQVDKEIQSVEAIGYLVDELKQQIHNI